VARASTILSHVQPRCLESSYVCIVRRHSEGRYVGEGDRGKWEQHNRRATGTLEGTDTNKPDVDETSIQGGDGRRWNDEVKDSLRTERMENLNPTYPSLEFFKSARDLSRLHFATLVQLRLEHFPAAVYLYRFKLLNSPDGPSCGLRTQSPFHVLIGRDAYIEQRLERDRTLGAASRSYKALLTPGKSTPHLMRSLVGVGE
jgi:hypothetical protein